MYKINVPRHGVELDTPAGLPYLIDRFWDARDLIPRSRP